MDSLIKNLSKKSKKLIIVGPIPPALLDFEDRKSFLKPESSSTESFEYYSKKFNKIIDRLKNNHKFDYISLKDDYCDNIKCETVFQNNYLYGDALHMSNYGQEKIIKPHLYNLISQK